MFLRTEPVGEERNTKVAGLVMKGTGIMYYVWWTKKKLFIPECPSIKLLTYVSLYS